MAVKTFSTNELLTSSDTNTYLANSGLVYITGTTFVSAQTAVSINGCYTSSFNNYRVIVRVADTTNGLTLYYRERASGSDAISSYSHVGEFKYLSGGTQYTATTGAQAQQQMTIGVCGNPGSHGGFIVDVYQPALAIGTQIAWQGGANSNNTSAYSGVGGGMHYVNTAYDGFTIFTSNNAFSGAIMVYGYREP